MLQIYGYPPPGYSPKPPPRYVRIERLAPVAVSPKMRTHAAVIPFPTPCISEGRPRIFKVIRGGKTPTCVACTADATHGKETFCVDHWRMLPRPIRIDFLVTRNSLRRAMLFAEARPFLK